MSLEITETERERFLIHLQKRSRVQSMPEKEQEIIRLSNENVSLKEIRRAVKSNNGYVTQVRARARRQGLL